MIDIYQYSHRPKPHWSLEALMTLRALPFVGNKFTCPCCGWRLRAFTYGGASLKIRDLGYCPRCNSKARHRRIWLFLKQKTNLFVDRLHVFHVSPNYCLSRRLINLPNLDYVAGDHGNHPNIRIKMNLNNSPVHSESFDVILCNHVLEHIIEDHKAIAELFRILKPGGWAVISVPINFDKNTYEDRTLITPEERSRAFGEPNHVRIYGYDFSNRLERSGFHVSLDLGKDLDQHTREIYGLRDNENIFYCTKD